MLPPDKMKPKLDALAESIGRSSTFMETRPLDIDSNSLQDHLTQSTIEALTELKTISKELFDRSDRDVIFARRILKAHNALKLISQLFLERREKERREAQPDRRQADRRKTPREI